MNEFRLYLRSRDQNHTQKVEHNSFQLPEKKNLFADIDRVIDAITFLGTAVDKHPCRLLSDTSGHHCLFHL